MTQKARISLTGTSANSVDAVCSQIREVAKRVGVKMSGPIPLPRKRLVVPCRKAPDGRGTAKWDHWEMRIHKRLIDIDADDRALKQLMRITIPDDVNIEIVLSS